MKMRRILSIILSMVLTLAALCSGVNAASANDGKAESSAAVPFTDVAESNWFYDAVSYVHKSGLMNGVTSTEFQPKSGLTRGMFVTILGRMAQVDQSAYTDTSFTDVKTDRWYSAYVEWAKQKAVTQGIGDNRFGVNEPVTREQMAAFISRYVDSEEIILPCAEDAVSEFKDAEKVSGWAEDGLELMRISGIIKGDDQGNFNPSSSATRAEAAAIFMRLQQAVRSMNEKEEMIFGSYEQDNNLENGAESIEWIVLKKEEGKVLLLSKYGLDAKSYNDIHADVTWETSSLRKWLNSTFLNQAFDSNQRSQILTVTVQNPDTYMGYDKMGRSVKNNTGEGIEKLTCQTSGGNATEDQVFLLSIDEAKSLLGYDSETLYKKDGESYTAYPDMQMSVTEYAEAQGAWISPSYTTSEGKACCWWWLRSPGSSTGFAAYVDYNGRMGDYSVSYEDSAVRPAVWINLED